MTKKYLIGIDSGTQSTKVVASDNDGNVLLVTQAVHEPMFQLQPGWAEQHPEDNWAKFCQATREAMEKLPFPKSEIAAIGLTGQRGTSTLVDRDGNHLRPFIVWLDIRYGNIGQWLKENEPEIVAKAYKLTSVQGWLNKKLTGEFKDCAAYPPTGPASVTTSFSWPEDPKEYESFGIPREMLVDLVPPGTVYGCITKEAAELTGLPEGLPVVSGAGDKQCEVLGGGAIAPGEAYATYGTLSSLITTVYDQYVASPTGAYYTLGAAVPGAWSPETSVRGHWMVTWFKEEFGNSAVLEAAKRGVSAEQILNEEAEKVPPGSQGLIVFPYWDARAVCPEARGMMFGFYNGTHKRPHVFRAILEGIAYGLRSSIDTYSVDFGVPIQKVVVGGGGSKSDIGMQATADIWGVPIQRPHTSETCALGAAMEAAVGTGMYQDFPEAVQYMTRAQRTFEPIPANQKLYDDVYNQVFTKVYPSFKEVFKNLNRITAYESGKLI